MKDHWPAPRPDGPVERVVSLPGSKSLTNRALVLAAIADGPSVVRRPLRSRDTLLMAGALTAFRYLKVSLAVVLAMVGTKMLAHHYLQELLGEHFNLYMLAAIVLILGTGIGASLLVSAPVESPAHGVSTEADAS